MTRSATWLVERSAAVLAGIDEPLTPLPLDQHARLERLRRNQDRDDFVAARVLTRRLVAQVTRRAASEVRFTQRCDRCGGPHGRPIVGLAGLYVSWSHAGGWVGSVVGTRPCGIDVEPVCDHRPLFDVLTAGEQQEVRSLPEEQQPRAFTRFWVRKEALIKAVGSGLSEPGDLARLDVRHDRVSYAERDWRLTDLPDKGVPRMVVVVAAIATCCA